MAGSELEDTAEADPGRLTEHLQRGASLGRYVVIDVLGRGGMSVVYAAFDPELNRRVAIKLVRPDLEGGAEATPRLLREAQAMAKVLHPNVVTVHDVGTWEGRVFLAMELIDGSTLRDWLSEQPRTRRELLALFAEAGHGLAAAHAAGLVHRDFKPDNVLVGKDGRARVTDFGLVRGAHATERAQPPPALGDASELVTQAGAILGTPAYMAPEQLLGQVADARADQFSFAVALYEALYGERPFEAHDFQTTFEAVTRGVVRPPPPASRVPGHLRRVLLRALSVNPGHRFPSMQALLAELRRDPVARLRRFALGAAVAVVALSGPAFIGWNARQEARRCEGTVRELDGVWDEGRRAQLQRVFAAPGVAPKAWERVNAWADRYAALWKQARHEACEASRTGTEDARLLAASGRCIEAQRLQFKAVIDLLLTSDAAALTLAERAFIGVGSVKACMSGLAAAPVTPTAADAALIEQIARARAHVLIGGLGAGEAAARAALETARARGNEALAAAALLELGRAQHQRGLATEALATYRQALLAAEATGEGELAFDVRLELGHLLSEYLERYDEALWVLAEAGAGARRLSLPPERIAAHLFAQASALEQADRPREALPLAEQALTLARSTALTPGELVDPLLALANLHSDLGHSTRASGFYEEYLEAQTHTSQRVEDYAIALSYSAEELVLVGEYERGLARLQESRAALGPAGGHATQVVLVDGWISYAAAAAGKAGLSEEARALAEAGRATLSQPHHLAELRIMLGSADLLRGRPSAALKSSLEASLALGPAASVNRGQALENALLQVEALRRLAQFARARETLEGAVAQAEGHQTDFETGLAHARALGVELALELHDAPPDAADVVSASLVVWTRDFGADNPELATTWLTLGRAELARGRRAEGLAALERAVVLSERRPGDGFGTAEARFVLARALGAEAATAARARALAEAALGALRQLPEPVPLTQQVERWLAHR
ncbi:MAG: serine/threonine-protein kinase [Archangium sp.]|nr:serine/threonine-protein kinase [Archangium sp.]